MSQVFLLDTDRLVATGGFDSYAAAEDVAARAAYNYVIVDEAADLEKLFSTSELVQLYNKHRPEHKQEVSKFRDKPTGAQRVIEALRVKADNLTESRAVGAPTEDEGHRPVLTQERSPDGESVLVKQTAKKRSVAAAFREAITIGLDKQAALSSVRAEFPERQVPDSYYAWYKADCKKKGLLS